MFWAMRRYLATRCVPFLTSFSHSYLLGGSQHAFSNFSRQVACYLRSVMSGCLQNAFTHGVGS